MKRTTLWNVGPSSAAIQSQSATGTQLVDTGQQSLGGVTIVRMRGELAIWLSVVTTLGDGFTDLTAGIGIVTNDAFAVGASAMPTPKGDSDWGGWLWHASLATLIGFETTEVLRGPMSAVRVPIDSKAMRKITGNETIFGAVQFGTEVGTATAQFQMNTRMLFKLS